jgi:hypothetical protein
LGYAPDFVTPTTDRVVYPPKWKCNGIPENCNVFEVNSELEDTVTFKIKVLNEGDKIYHSDMVSF